MYCVKSRQTRVGRVRVGAGNYKVLNRRRCPFIAFDSMERAQAWYDSPAYRAIRPIRHKSATSRVYIVEGAPEARSQ